MIPHSQYITPFYIETVHVIVNLERLNPFKIDHIVFDIIRTLQMTAEVWRVNHDITTSTRNPQMWQSVTNHGLKTKMCLRSD